MGITEAEQRCGESDVSELRAATITSPAMRKEFRRTLAAPTYDSIWENLINPISTNSVNTTAVFYGLWDSCTVGIWALELVVDSFSLAHNGQVRLVANLFGNHAFRTSAAFAVIQ